MNIYTVFMSLRKVLSMDKATLGLKQGHLYSGFTYLSTGLD